MSNVHLEYMERHLVYHLEKAGEWDKILALVNHPTFGQKAKEALSRRDGSYKTYVLCKLGQIGSMTFEEVLQACGEQDRDKLVEYASKYHFDVMSDPDDMGYYRGLVIYECSWGEDPYEYWGTSEG